MENLTSSYLLKIVSFLIFFIWLPSSSVTAKSGLRTALVIGNSNYQTAPLRNPVNDARAMADSLKKLGFNVIYAEDADRSEMRQAIRTFEEKLSKSKGTGLFYYAGHGVQLHGRNYLIPIGADIHREYEVPDETILADLILQAMAYAGNDLNIVILDACRNNPYPKSFRSAARGLARMETMGSGMLIAYATSPGSVAFDGDEDNGIYTKHLLKAMNTPGLSIEQIFKAVRQNVIQDTAKAQTPWEESSLTGDFYFITTGNATITINQPPKSSTVSPEKTNDLIFWQGISKSRMKSDYEQYLNTFPDGVFAALAQSRIESLNGAQSTVVTDQPSRGNSTLINSLRGLWRLHYRENDKDNYLQLSFEANGTGNSEGDEPDGSWWAEPITWKISDSILTIAYSHDSIETLEVRHVDESILKLHGITGNNKDETLNFKRLESRPDAFKLSTNFQELFGSWKETWEEDDGIGYQIVILRENGSAHQQGSKPGEKWSDSGTWKIIPPDILSVSGDDFEQRFQLIHVTPNYLDMIDLSPDYMGQGSRFKKIER